MPYTKEQLRAYWQANKAILNQKRRQKRRLAKLGLTTAEVSHGKPANGKPFLEMANPQLTRLIQEWQTQTNYSCAPGCSADKYCSNC
jgi:hypothetical protein